MDWYSPKFARRGRVGTYCIEIFSPNGPAFTISLEHGNEGDDHFTRAVEPQWVSGPMATTGVSEDPKAMFRLKFERPDVVIPVLPPKRQDGGSGREGEPPT